MSKPLSLCALITVALAAAGADKPNIVFIMADDMGYGDPGCYNPQSKIPTPHLDKLAAQGIRFTDAHAPAAVCVPTRYSLLTGRYPFRMKKGGISRIPAGTMTLGSLLQKNGYHTVCIGKWHLGFQHEKNPPPEMRLAGGPVDHGFDFYFGIPASLDIQPYYYIENDRPVARPTEKVAASSSPGVTPIQGAFWRAGGIAPGFKHVEVLPTLTEKAIDSLSTQAKSEKPFFLYVALPAPHTPWLPTRKFQGRSKAGSYGDFTVQVDESVGRILGALDRLKLTKETLVIFTSDNGPVWYEADEKKYEHHSTGVLRGMKGDAWEGGHRMPFVARWPGKIKEGMVSDETICHTDMLRTFAAILGTTLPKDAGGDSYNILPALLGKQKKHGIREATVHQSSRGVLAIRQGPWKLIPALGSGGFSKPSRVKPTKNGPKGQLYHLGEDLGETTNLYRKHPDVVQRLSALLAKYKSQSHSVVEAKSKQ